MLRPGTGGLQTAAKLMMSKNLTFNSVTKSIGQQGWYCLGLFALLLVTYWIYTPGLSGPLLLDDFWNLRRLGENGGVNNLDNLREFLFGNSSGPSGRPVSMAAFLLDAQDWPPIIQQLKFTNIMLHLLCGAVLSWFALLVGQLAGLDRTRAGQAALLVTALWLFHPFNVSTVLYVVQRMTQLMTLFALCALTCYLLGRTQLETNSRKGGLFLCLSLFPFGLLSVLSKENGALLLCAILILEVLYFRETKVSRFFKVWFYAGIVIPLIVIVLYLVFGAQETMSLYEVRHFSLGERLLTQARALTDYLINIFVPNTWGAGLYHDDYVVSRSLISPLSTLFSVAAVVALLSFAVMFSAKLKLWSFAILWFFSLHILESSFLPLELYFEHRNYLPMIGPLLALAISASKWVAQLENQRAQQAIVLIVATFLVSSIVQTRISAIEWGDVDNIHFKWAEENPESLRAQITLADHLNLIGRPDLAMERLEYAHNLYPNEITINLFIWNQSCEFALLRTRTLQEIIDIPQLEYYRDDVNHHLQVLLENLMSGRCTFPDFETVEALFSKVSEFPLPAPRRAAFHVFFSDLYVHFRVLNPALINLTRAFELNPDPQIPIRQAILSASAGNFSDAMVFLGRARQAESENNPLLPSLEGEIDRLESDFSAQL